MKWLTGFGPLGLAHPHMLYLLIGVGVIFVWSMFQVDTPRRIFAPMIRAMVLALVVLALADPERIVDLSGAGAPGDGRSIGQHDGARCANGRRDCCKMG